MLFVTLPHLNLEFLKTLKAFATILRDPGQTDSIFDIVEGFRNSEAFRLAVDYIKTKPGNAEIIAERYTASVPVLDELITYPADSLGYAYAKAMKAGNFDPEFYRQVTVEDDISYVMLRMRQTHDIWHTITDFGMDTVGELGLQAFSLAQTHLPLPVILIAGGLLRTLLKSPQDLDGLLDRLAAGYRIGAKAKPFLAQKWEEGWDKPLETWREELGVEVMPIYQP
jgi:ubiquinone biosynthesis protein COQ4